jgi:hypothetical protein
MVPVTLRILYGTFTVHILPRYGTHYFNDTVMKFLQCTYRYYQDMRYFKDTVTKFCTVYILPRYSLLHGYLL